MAPRSVSLRCAGPRVPPRHRGELPQSATTRRRGEAQFGQTIQHQIPPASPYGWPSSPPLASSARPGALRLKCHLPNIEGSRGRGQVTRVSRRPAGKGSSPPISQSCITTAAAAAAAAKSLQSCPILCDPIDGSPLGSSVPGILQARILEWVAMSFSNAWKWKVKVKPLSRARLLATPWTAAYQAPPSTGFSRQEYWSGGAIAFSAGKQQQQQKREFPDIIIICSTLNT